MALQEEAAAPRPSLPWVPPPALWELHPRPGLSLSLPWPRSPMAMAPLPSQPFWLNVKMLNTFMLEVITFGLLDLPNILGSQHTL